MSKRRIVGGMALVLLLVHDSSSGVDLKRDPIDIRLQECMNADWTTAGMNNCTNEAYEAWDRVLNDAYTKLLKRLDKGAGAALKDSQREWIRYRDCEFKFVNAYYGSFIGSIYSNMNHGDKMDIVKNRAMKLRAYLQLLDTM